MTFKKEDAEKLLGDARVTLGIGYGQSVSDACAALMDRLIDLGENPTRIAREAVRGQTGVVFQPKDA